MTELTLATSYSSVKWKFAILFAIIEIPAIAILNVFLRPPGFHDRLGLIFICCLPIAFGLHVTEEFVLPGGFIEWNRLYRPKFAAAPASYFFRVNLMAGVAAVLVSLGCFNYKGGYSLPGLQTWLVFAVFMALNAAFHLRGALVTGRYSPGMFTGMFLFVPLAASGVAHFTRTGALGPVTVLGCVILAFLIQPTLDFFKALTTSKRFPWVSVTGIDLGTGTPVHLCRFWPENADNGNGRSKPFSFKRLGAASRTRTPLGCSY